MLGAIAGDIIGSPYEFTINNIKTTTFPLFIEKSRFTDDTVCTIAVGDALMNACEEGVPFKEAVIKSLKHFGTLFPQVGYGERFWQWLMSNDTVPYNSWGNGSAMRVSSVGWVFDTLERTLEAAEVSAAVTHNHPEGIKGAQATAAAIFMARTGADQKDTKRLIENRFNYNLSTPLSEIRPTYHHDSSCQGSVPQAIRAYLEAHDFESSVRNAVSLGGDSDTIAAITGSIAEAAWGIPDSLVGEVSQRLDPSLCAVLKRWQKGMSVFQEHSTTITLN